MGNLLKKLTSTKTELRLLMIGLDSAGKTTILYKLKLGNVVSSKPTVGFNVETVKYKNIKFTVWDVGGQDALRPLWRHYYQGVGGLVYVVDSNDVERVSEAGEQLAHVLQHPDLGAAALLVLANKQDLPNAMSRELIAERMNLSQVAAGHDHHIQETCAHTGAGISEGMDWLAKQVVRKQKQLANSSSPHLNATGSKVNASRGSTDSEAPGVAGTTAASPQ